VSWITVFFVKSKSSSITGITFPISGVGSIDSLVVMIRTVDGDSVHSNVIFRPDFLSTFS
ncbi:MAG: hypothetical protein QN716_12670, partial [Nitrososphaeraceae archaeon]|nr:hypothetical protein [Nitrososphaeraceae archaeon]